MRPDPRAEPDEPIPDTLPEARPPAQRHALPPPAPSSGPRTRPSSPAALRVADILAEGRRAAGLPATADTDQEPPT